MTTSPASAIGWLAFPTLERRDLLVRAIKSYVGNLDQFGRSASVLVVDGSAHDGEREQDLDALRALSSASGKRMFYLGAREKRAHVERLSAMADIPAPVMRFALFGTPGPLLSYGANRNAILLATSGHALLSADDDTVCRVGSMAPATETEPSIHVVREQASPEQIWFHESRAEAIRSVDWRSEDLLGWHEGMLGRIVAGTPDRRTAVVSTGVVGDCAMSSPAGLVATTDEPTRSRLLASEDTYRRALTSREIVRQALVPTITEAPHLMMTAASLDNTGLLPPFMPMGRNEDGLYARLLRRCCPGAHIGHLPVAILHAPKGRRTYDASSVPMRVSEVLQLCVEDWSRSAASAGSPAERMESVGKFLVEIGSLPQPDFDRAIHSLVGGSALARIELLVALLDRNRYHPPYWVDGIHRQILHLERAAADPWFSIPQDLRGAGSAQGGMAELKSLIANYGLLLRGWPTIVAMTARVRYPLATEVRA